MVNEGSMNVYGSGSRFNVIYNELGFTPTDANIEVSKHGQSINSEAWYVGGAGLKAANVIVEDVEKALKL